jgi:hypothetical protein
VNVQLFHERSDTDREPDKDPRLGSRVFYLHVYPVPHTSHIDLADRLGVPWGAAMGEPGRRSWVVAIRNAVRLAWRKDWDVLLADGTCHEGPLLRFIDLRCRKRVLLDAANAVDSLFESYRDGGLKGAVLRWEARLWDAYVVLCDKDERAIRRYIGEQCEVARWTPAVTLGDPFGGAVSHQTGPPISIMHGGSDYTVWYKGLDRLAETSLRGVAEGWGPIQVFGRWPEELRRRFADSLQFGGLREPNEVLRNTSMLVHLSREEAFGLAIVEAMIAGVPPVVGDAGAGTLVANVEPRLVARNVDEALAAVNWIRNLPSEEYRCLCWRVRNEGLRYAEMARDEAALTAIRNVLEGPRRNRHAGLARGIRRVRFQSVRP